MFEKIIVGIIGKEDDIDVLAAKRILVEYKIPFGVIDEAEVDNKIMNYSLLLIDASKNLNYICDYLLNFLENDRAIIFYGALNFEYKNLLNLKIKEEINNVKFKSILSSNHPIVNNIENREFLIMGNISLIEDCKEYEILGKFTHDENNDNVKYPSIIASKKKNIAYIPFNICQQVILWETEQYAKNKKLSRTHNIINALYNSTPSLLKRNIKKYSRKVRKKMSNQKVSYTNCPIEYNSDTIRMLVINTIKYLSLETIECLPTLSKWPLHYKAAMVITHDIDTHDDYEHGVPVLSQIEDKYDIKSTWCFVAQSSEYTPSPDILSELVRNGHEIASHGLYHDIQSNKISSKEREKRITESKKVLEHNTKKYKINGYRSPGLTRTPDLCHLIEKAGYEYDMSYPDNDHYNLFHFGMGVSSHVPYNPITKINSEYKELKILELPLASLQEANLFIDHKLTEKEAINVWIKKGEQIIFDGGLVVFLFHPSIFISEPRAEMYEKLIQHFRNRYDLYIATSNNVAAWWNKRKLVDIITRKCSGDEWEIIVNNRGKNPITGLKLEIHSKKKKKLNIITGDIESIICETFKWYDTYYLNIATVKSSSEQKITFELSNKI